MAKYRRRRKRNETQAEELELTGAVKHMQQTTYRAFLKNGEAVQDKIEGDASLDKNIIVSFTEKGTKTSETIFNGQFKYDKRFNENGQEIENIQYYKGALYQVATQSYYPNKHHHEHITRDAHGDLVWRNDYILNERGQVASHHVWHGKEDKLVKETIHTYLDDGQLLSIIEYNADGSIHHKSENIYNEKGLRIEHISAYTDETKRQWNNRQTYQYNEHGDCILTSYYDGYGVLKDSFGHVYEYDADGKRIDPPRPAPS